MMTAGRTLYLCGIVAAALELCMQMLYYLLNPLLRAGLVDDVVFLGCLPSLHVKRFGLLALSSICNACSNDRAAGRNQVLSPGSYASLLPSTSILRIGKQLARAPIRSRTLCSARHRPLWVPQVMCTVFSFQPEKSAEARM